MGKPLYEAVDELASAITLMKQALKDSIMELGDNPAIKRLSSNAFVISSKELFKHDNWCPHYHDFPFQYQIICDKLDTLLDTPKDAQRILTNILQTGRVTTADNKLGYKLHPDVIVKLTKIINGE